MQIGAARFRASEVLFRPDLLGEECEGIHEVLMYAIQKSDMDLRKTLYQNIVLSGGSTLLKGFGDRLLSELKKSLPKDSKIRVSVITVILDLNCRSFMNIFCFYRFIFHADRCAARKALFNLDGRIDFGIARYIQTNVGIKA